MLKTVVQAVLVVLAMVFSSALVYVGVGFLTNQIVANRLKQYEQRWHEDDARIQKLEAQINQLEKRRDELHAAAEKEMTAAAAIALEGQSRDTEIRSRPLTPALQAARNGTRILKPVNLGNGKGIATGDVSWPIAKDGQGSSK